MQGKNGPFSALLCALGMAKAGFPTSSGGARAGFSNILGAVCVAGNEF